MNLWLVAIADMFKPTWDRTSPRVPPIATFIQVGSNRLVRR
jgi:hypothetical protein